MIADAQQDNSKQVAQIETFLRQKPDLLIVAPNERAPLTEVMGRAYRSGIPVICLERDILEPNDTTYIKSDNRKIGQMAGQFIVDHLTKKYGSPRGRMVHIRGLLGASRYTRTHVLSRAGFTVQETATGLETLAALSATCPDLVLLDVHLPDLDGVEVCRRIKGLNAGVIVLQVSASATLARDATAALNAGSDAYPMEPVDPEVLVATIRALLRLRKAEKELATANDLLRDANQQLNTANSALRRSNEDLQQFAHVASHDLQEPLRTIIAHAQLLQRSLATRLDPAERESLDVMASAAERMHALVRDILTYSSLGREAPDLQEISLNEAVQWAMVNVGESLAKNI